MMQEWKDFNGGIWTECIDVEDFILKNYHEYKGDDSFLEGISGKTKKVWNKMLGLLKEELEKGVLDIETNIVSGIDNFKPGYIDKENEIIVGLQTDAPLKRIVNLYGGIRMAHTSLEAYGYKLDDTVDYYFKEFRKSHNDGVFDAYTPEIRINWTTRCLW